MTTNFTRSLALAVLLAPSLVHAVSILSTAVNSHCGLANGAAYSYISGGIPPYNVSWSNGAFTNNIYGLLPGTYTVTVVDGMGGTAQSSCTVVDIPTLAEPSQQIVRYDCGGSCSGWTQIEESTLAGAAPYTYSWPFPDVSGGYATFMGTCAFQLNPLQVTDANGCTGDFQLIVWDSQPGMPDVELTSPACGGQSNGSVTINYLAGGPATFKVTAPGGNPWGAGPIVDLFNPPYTITGLAAGDYEVWYWDTFGTPPLFQPGPVHCTLGAPFAVGALAGPCGTIQGTVYHDADQDCVYNGFDLLQPYRVITIDPVGSYSITDGQGHYQQNLEYGSYDVSQAATPSETQICPAVSPQPFTIDALNTSVTTDFANLSTVPHDLSVWLSSSTARPGFPTQVWVSVHNNSAFPSGTVSVDLTYDALLLNPSPASGQWNLGVIPPYGYVDLDFTAEVPPNINLLGTLLNYIATVTNSAGESNTANNNASLDVTITGSYDPNDKQGTTSSALSPNQYFLAQDEWIDYTVRFQNTGTAAAETVVVRDTIDTDLFIPSLEILGASHAFTPSFGFGDGRELVFSFDNIDLPDSTTDLLGSQGFISYRIKPKSDVVVGTLLENTAGIYFDFNPPIITNTVTHVVDFSTGMQGQVPFDSAQVLRLLPNPASDVLNVILPEGSSAAITVHSIDGRAIDIPSTGKAGHIQLEVRSLAPGTYLVRTAAGAARFTKN